jgi:glycosyltransferase involved in cell wall biosynthesis
MSSFSLGVVVPAYNASATIEECVQSAFAAGAAQVVVVDDGSIDGTGKLAALAGARVIVQRNSGAAAARRLGLETVDGETDAVVFLDADDSLVAGGVESAIAMLNSGDFSAVYGRTVGLHADGRETLLKSWSVPVTTRTLLERGYGPCPPASVVWSADYLRRAMSDEIEALWPRYAEDYELMIRGTLLAPIGATAKVTSRYRMTGGKSATSAIRSVNDAERIREHYAAISGLPIRPRGRRSQQALALIRNASGEPRGSRGRYAFLVKAAIHHPPTVLSFAAQTFSQKR